MLPLRHAAERLSAWFSVRPPASFTYRSYLRYLARALPRYGIGPLVIVAYQVVTRGGTRGVLYAAWLLCAVATSLVGFALTRRDPGYAAGAGSVACGAYAFLYVWLPAAGLGRWLLAFTAWMSAIAAAVGAAAAAR